MSDYSKQTVANLRQLLKDRGIPSTGLTRKAQIIEKLEEWDSKESDTPDAAEPAAAPSAAQPDAEEEESRDEPVPALEKSAQEGELKSAQEAEKPTEPAPSVVAPEPIPEPAQTEAPPTASAPTPPEQLQDAGTAEDASATQPPEDPAIAPPELAEQVETETKDAPPAQATPKEPETPAVDTTMADKTPSPDPNEKPSVEKAELFPIPEQSSNTTADTSRLNSEERESETRKRKRRSQSPELSTQEVRAKKPRPSQEPVPDVHLKEDGDVVMEQRRPEEGKEHGVNGHGEGEATKEDGEAASETKSPALEPDAKRAAPEKKEKAPRYKELFQPAAPDTSAEAITDDRPIVPALHPATPAVYIRNFMRPLRPEPLRNHLVSLASPPSKSPDPTIVKSLFLDAMKTHALVLFSTTTAASRVRASLHGSIWPPEGNRKELWVDFIPDDQVEDWIKEEEDAIFAEKESRTTGRPIPAKRFEVVYPETEDGSIRAVFQEVGAGGSSNAPFNAPRGPRSNIEVRRSSYQQQQAPPALPTPTAPTQATRQTMDKNFDILGQHFACTTAKPKLYFLPVSDEIADARLKDLDVETSRDWFPEEKHKGRGIANRGIAEKARYSFDDQDRVVDIGEDFGPWAEDRRRGGGRGGYRGGYRGSFRGRGFRGGGDPWRG